MSYEYPYCFMFVVEHDGVLGWVAAEGHALEHVLAVAPELTAAQLDNVWSCNNMIWGFLQRDGAAPVPWEDDPEDVAVTVPPTVYPFQADPALERRA